MALLASYEDEFRELLKGATAEMATLRSTLQRTAATYKAPPAAGPESRGERLTQLKVGVNRLRELGNMMDAESNDVVPPAERAGAKDRVAEYRKQSMHMEKEYVKLKDDCSKEDKEDLLSGAAAKAAAAAVAGAANAGEAASAAADEDRIKYRTKMVGNTALLETGSKKLNQAEQVINEAVTYSESAKTNLRQQRETLTNIYNTTDEVDGTLTSVRKTLKEMHLTMIKNKAVMVVIILALLLMIFVVIYVKLGTSSTGATRTTIIVQSPSPMPPTLAPMVTSRPAGAGSGSGAAGSLND